MLVLLRYKWETPQVSLRKLYILFGEMNEVLD